MESHVHPSERVCANCGCEEELYYHAVDEAWVCEDSGYCIERQRDQAVAERDRYRRALSTIVERWEGGHRPRGPRMLVAIAKDALREAGS